MKNIAFISLFFLLTSGHTNANAVGGTVGGWRITSNVAQGIGAKITATKDVIINGASKAVTSSASVLPKAADVGKFMGKNLGAAAVVGAMDLLLDGVDYVMDPANNSVTYKPKQCSTNCQYLYQLGTRQDTISSTPQQVCQKLISLNYWQGGETTSSTYSASKNTCERTYTYAGSSHTSTSSQTIRKIANPNYDQSKEEEKKTVPLSEIGQQVIDQAQSEVQAGNPAQSAAVTRAVAQDMIQQAEADDVKARPIAQELEKNPSYPTTEEGEGTVTQPEVVDPATGEVVKPAEQSSIKFTFPKACEWFPQACVFIDWMMQDYQEEDPPELPKEEMELKEIDEDLINLNASSCPAPLDVSIALPMFNTTYNDSIDISEYCTKLEDLAPVLQLISIVIAVMILARI